MKTAVEPSEFVTKHTITDIEIMVSFIVLFERVNVLVKLYDEDKIIDTRILEFEGDDYKRWLVDDDLVNLTLERLGLTVRATVTTPATATTAAPAEAVAPNPTVEQTTTTQ